MKEPIELRIRSSEKETLIECSRGGEDLLEVVENLIVWLGQCFGMTAPEMLDYLRNRLEDSGKEAVESVQIDEEAIRKALEQMEGEDDGQI